MIALADGAFTNHWFIEADKDLADALDTRCGPARRQGREVTVLHGDCNTRVEEVVAAINETDSVFVPGAWKSLSVAFADPTGLEVAWSTIRCLSTLNRVDMLIYFPTNPLRRVYHHFLEPPVGESKADLFFPSPGWREHSRYPSGSLPLQAWVDDYNAGLESLGFLTGYPKAIDDKGRELYRLLFASNHERGIEFWNDWARRDWQLEMFSPD